MLAWVYGTFTSAERDGDEDAYSLFYKRSDAMGWMSDAGRPWRRGLWGMNDAGLVPAEGTGPALSSWFQVAVTPGSFPGTPVHPFLICIEAVLAELGELELERLQVLLPAPDGAAGWDDAAGHLAGTAGWFIGRRRAPGSIRMSVDGGSQADLAASAPAIVARLRSLSQGVFELVDASVLDPGGQLAPPRCPDVLWGGPARHRLALAGELVDWSLDAIGWAVSLVSWACQDAGVAAPLLITVLR